MKKSKKKPTIKPEEFLKDLEGVLNLVEKIDKLDLEKTDLKTLKKIIKNKETTIKNKYKDLDTKK